MPARSGSRASFRSGSIPPTPPGDRGLWLKIKCPNREEFVVVGWTDPEGSRPFIGALLLGYYDPGGRLIYAGRVGTGMRADQLSDLLRRLQPLQTDRMPLDVPPPRSTRFGAPLVLSRIHWVRPELVVEVKYLTWTDDGLLRQVGINIGAFKVGLEEESGQCLTLVRGDVPHRDRGDILAHHIS